jgi:hypothetical protein
LAGGEQLLTGVEQSGTTVHDLMNNLHWEIEEMNASLPGMKTEARMGGGRRSTSNGGRRSTVSTGERNLVIKPEKNRRSLAWRDRRDNSNTTAAYGDVQVDGFVASTSATAELDAAPL